MYKQIFGIGALVLLISISACTNNQFSALESPSPDTISKTPGYYNPNDQHYALPNNPQPIAENKFYWKQDQDDKAVAPQ